ncbi:MAG: hypothetical protein IPQ03_11685 [Bacteroidetes bacterium]|nr:hypothetical protein [Bacteroidota bacterium]
MEGMIYKTSNAGGSWLDFTVSREVNNQNTLLHSVFSTGNGIIYAGADNTIGSGSTLFKSTDNAITWTPLSFSQTIWSLYFTSADTGFAATSNGLVKTTDGGNSWNNVLTSSSALHTIQLKNEFGIAAGENGIIYMTADSGNSWTSVPSPVTTTLSDISILSSNLAYAVGASGTFLKYTNSTSTPELPKLVDFNCWLSNTSSLNIVWNNSNDQATLIER